MVKKLLIIISLVLAFEQSCYAQGCPTGQMMVSNNGASACSIYPATQQVNSDWNATSGVAQILNEPTILPRSFNNSPAHTIQTVAAASNGFQLSTIRDAFVSYSIGIVVTASIVSGQSGYVVLEISPTNSAVAANWAEIERTPNSQTYTLAIALQGVQGNGAPLTGIVPAGYYARLRSVNITGAPSYSYSSGQEVLL